MLKVYTWLGVILKHDDGRVLSFRPFEAYNKMNGYTVRQAQRRYKHIW